MSFLPALPELNHTELTIEVYQDDTIRALRSQQQPENMKKDFGNIARLEFLGAKFFDLAVVSHYFNQEPLCTMEDMKAKKDRLTSEDNLKLWQTTYNLKSRIVSIDPSKLDDPEEIQKFFHRFVGALYFRQGHDAALQWVSHLIDADPVEKPQDIGKSQNTVSPPSPAPLPSPSNTPASTTLISHPPVATSSPSPKKSPTTSTHPSLATVNQRAQQEGFQVTYIGSKDGPQHLPTWTMICCINGVEKGKGTANSQKVAKELAARTAWAAMGW